MNVLVQVLNPALQAVETRVVANQYALRTTHTPRRASNCADHSDQCGNADAQNADEFRRQWVYLLTACTPEIGG